jgi:hypothetical protein
MDSETVAQKEKNKKPFVIREIPSETALDSRLRGNALQLLALFWSKADVRTGEVRIGSHWFTQHELVRMAKKIGISERTFRNVLRSQLVPCGYVKELERKLMDHTDSAGRMRKIPGSQHYIVFKTSQEPHGQRTIRKAKPKQKPAEHVSTTGKNLPDVENTPPLGDSTSGKHLPDEEKSSTSGNSTSGVDLPHNTYSKAPTSPAVGGDGVHGSGLDSRDINHRHQSTTTKRPDDDRYKRAKSKYAYMDPTFRAWIRNRILSKASPSKPVLSPDGYVYTVLPDFLENCDGEMEIYLSEKLTAFAIRESRPMPYREIFTFLQNEAAAHHFYLGTVDSPSDNAFLRRVIEYTREALGLKTQKPN